MLFIGKTFEWDMGHRVPGHKNLCKNPHGHRYKMILNVSGPLNDEVDGSEEDMIIDFVRIKKVINEKIIDELDHAFMYYDKDEIMHKFYDENSNLKSVVVPFIPTAESIVVYLKDKANLELDKISKELSIHSIELYETPKSKAVWVK